MSGKVSVIMGSKSDFDVVKPCLKVLSDFGVEYEIHVYSAHNAVGGLRGCGKCGTARLRGDNRRCRKSRGSCRRACGAYVASRHRLARCDFDDGRPGQPAFHRANAVGRACCDRRGKRRRKRGTACRPHSVREISRPQNKVGRAQTGNARQDSRKR